MKKIPLCAHCRRSAIGTDLYPADAEFYVTGKCVRRDGDGYVPYRGYICAAHMTMMFEDGAELTINRLIAWNGAEVNVRNLKNSKGEQIENMKMLLEWMPENVREVAEGRRIGIPTLTRQDRMHQIAAALSGKEVCWRDESLGER